MTEEQHALLMRQKADFDATHAAGMVALNAGDFDVLGAALAREREIIRRQSDLLSEAGADF